MFVNSAFYKNRVQDALFFISCYNNHIHYINNSCSKEGFHAKSITEST